ncbi:hypothetical protein OG895_02600 [Streptomyces sp. NBC_00201]|uniref:hypothetical protein n=1 Tax=unclassified Streptomyces TaxID=2593676 RepID=UPI00224EA7C4|nr:MULTISPECIES: hypothetical protein [unclassified Streptomyces]MCX5058975.1 hypothetical protein [Streptomyces sp. NBC_00452]MCX5244145.1 hypothetical protein [Streptomyces sp. NBC_00201]MCX5290122.1 hypothetical protein [Streptomyces sp. NBC_00183]
MTDTERQTAHARTSLAPAPGNAPTAPQTEQVPAYALHGNAERLRDLADAQPAPGSPSRTEPCDPRT